MTNSRFLLIFVAALMSCPAAWAASDKSAASASKSAAEPAPAPKKGAPVDKELQEELRKAAEEKKKELNGTQWQVATGSNNPKVKPGVDIFTFQNNQVTSKALSDKGYAPTNYTVTVDKGSDTAVWETMQTSSSGDVASIRAEWKEDTMKGIVVEQIKNEKQSLDYWFSSQAKKSVSPESKKTETAASPTGAAASAPSSQPAKAKTSTEAAKTTKKKTS